MATELLPEENPVQVLWKLPGLVWRLLSNRSWNNQYGRSDTRFDNNPNGLQEEGEKPFNETVVITMYDELGYPVDGKTTESDTTTGLYEITGIKPGKYELEFELPGDSEYQFTVPFAGEDDRIDSDVRAK